MLQNGGTERGQFHPDPRRQEPGVEREIGATEARHAAKCRGDVPDGGEVAHFIDGNAKDLLAPAAGGGGLGLAQALGRLRLETERGVEVGAHQVVLDLGRLVQRVHEQLARRVPQGLRPVHSVHRFLLGSGGVDGTDDERAMTGRSFTIDPQSVRPARACRRKHRRHGR